jgi:hypothetical protein
VSPPAAPPPAAIEIAQSLDKGPTIGQWEAEKSVKPPLESEASILDTSDHDINRNVFVDVYSDEEAAKSAVALAKHQNDDEVVITGFARCGRVVFAAQSGWDPPSKAAQGRSFISPLLTSASARLSPRFGACEITSP